MATYLDIIEAIRIKAMDYAAEKGWEEGSDETWTAAPCLWICDLFEAYLDHKEVPCDMGKMCDWDMTDWKDAINSWKPKVRNGFYSFLISPL